MEAINTLLGANIRILLSDGRIVEGELDCLDKDMNVIIRNTKEFHNCANRISENELGCIYRSIGTSMVPGKHVIQCFCREMQ